MNLSMAIGIGVTYVLVGNGANTGGTGPVVPSYLKVLGGVDYFLTSAGEKIIVQ